MCGEFPQTIMSSSFINGGNRVRRAKCILPEGNYTKTKRSIFNIRKIGSLLVDWPSCFVMFISWVTVYILVAMLFICLHSICLLSVFWERLLSFFKVNLAGHKSALNHPVVYSTDRFNAVVPVLIFLLLCGLFYEAICLSLVLALCYFVLVFFSPFSIAIPSLGEEKLIFRFALVWFCLFPLPLRV